MDYIEDNWISDKAFYNCTSLKGVKLYDGIDLYGNPFGFYYDSKTKEDQVDKSFKIQSIEKSSTFTRSHPIGYAEYIGLKHNYVLDFTRNEEELIDSENVVNKIAGYETSNIYVVGKYLYSNKIGEEIKDILKQMREEQSEKIARRSFQRLANIEVAMRAGFRKDEDEVAEKYTPIDWEKAKIGDKVMIMDLNQEVIILFLPDKNKNVQIQMGLMKTKIKQNKLAVLNKNLIKKCQPVLSI